MGINGIFGVMGIGLGGIFAGFLIELWGWQMAFIVPAILTLVAGGFLGYHILIKKLPLQNSSTAEPVVPKKSSQLIGIALIMLVSIFCLGLVFQMTQTAVPKLLEIRFILTTASLISQERVIVFTSSLLSSFKSFKGCFCKNSKNFLSWIKACFTISA